VVYGSLTAALVFLYSMYLYSSALLLGAEVAAAWSRPETKDAEPIRTQLRRGVLGLFVRQNLASADKTTPDPTRDHDEPGPRSAPGSS
jgi:hypothetical protein